MNVKGREISTNSGADAHCFDSSFHQMSHDLRTPLNAINGFAELLLLDDGLSPAHADYVRAILTGSEALTATVTSYLAQSQESEAGAVPMLTPMPGGEAGPAPRRSVFNCLRRSAPALRLRSNEV